MDIGDLTLVGKAREGDAAALEALLDRHYERLLGFCWRLVGPPPDCEDLCQDLCIKIAKSLKGFEGQAEFTTWAYAIALNLARDLGRKRARRAELKQHYQETQAEALADQADDRARADWLRAAIWQLAPDLRETLVLVLEEGLSHGEAAQILGIREGTVSWRLNQARGALKHIAQSETEALA